MTEVQVPCRVLSLRALRRLAKGHLLTVVGTSSLEIYLDGVPNVCHVFKFLIDEELIQQVRQTWAGEMFELSEKGRRVYQAGESWWKSLPLRTRAVLAAREG